MNDYNDTAKIEALQNYYRTSYASLNVDILMTIGLPSSNFVLKRGRDLFGEAPVVLISAARRGLVRSDLPANVTGIFEAIDVKGSIDAALRLRPQTRRIAIICGASETDRYYRDMANAYMFDWRQLKKWRIREESLPQASIVRYKTPSFFELYGTAIIAVMVLIAIETILIAALLFNRKNYLKARRALQKSHGHLEERVERRTEALKAENQERVRAEQQLKASEAFLGTIIDAIQDGITVLDRDFNIILANETVKSMYATEGPPVGKKCYEVFFGQDRPCGICPSVRVLKTGKTAMDEVPFPKFGDKDATAELFAFPILDADGQIVAVVEYIRDITERVRSRALLAEREQVYRSLFDKNVSIMLLIDPQSGAIVDANPSACTYYGYSKEALMQMSISDINTLSDEEVREEMRRAASDDRTQFNFRHRLSNGDIRDVEVFSGPISVSGKTLLCSIVHDISRRKAAENDREKLIDQLQKALSEVKTLQGFLPICAACKKIRDDQGYWNQIESYIQTHSNAQFSHSLCPDCVRKPYPDYYQKKKHRGTD